MPRRDTSTPMTTRFAYSAEADGYVLELVPDGSDTPMLQVTLASDVVEGEALQRTPLSLELRPNGAVVAYSDTATTSDLAAVSLANLVKEALALVDVEDATDLQTLETTLQDALETTRQARARLSDRK